MERARGSRYEVSTVGFDYNLQGIGGDPDGSGYGVGIRIPAAIGGATPANSRYMFMLARARFGAHRKVRLVGIRQLLTIGFESGGNYPLELEVRSPFWKFTDGNVSWHLRRVPPTIQQLNNVANAEGLAYLDSQTAALLYLVPPTGGYVPPAKVPGVPLLGQLGTFYDLRWNWRDDHAFESIDAQIEGPCDIVLYASVRQTNPGTRTTLTLPGSLPAGTGSIPLEDAFVSNFSSAMYWRIAGSLIFQEEDFIGEPPETMEHWNDLDGPKRFQSTTDRSEPSGRK